MSLEEYKSQVADYLKKNMNYTEQEIKDSFEMYEPILQKSLNVGISVRAMAGRMFLEL